MARFDYQPGLDLLNGCKTAAVCGHVNPDGDCIGSVLALTACLRALGIETTPLLATRDCPPTYDFLEGYDELIPACEYAGSPDVFVSVDVPSLGRTGDGEHVASRAGKLLAFDHHQPLDTFADVTFADEHAAAAGMLVWEFVQACGIELTPGIAMCCYVALATDTGRFQYQNADSAAFEAAAQMVASGADAAEAARLVYQRRSMAAMQLDALVTSRMELVCDGRAVISWVSESDFERLGASKEDGESLIDTVRQLAGVEVAVMLREQRPIVRGSIRSKTDFDVAAVARHFDGGGHKAAAGFTFKGSLKKARAQVVAFLEEAFREEQRA